MATPQRSPSTTSSSEENGRKRVCKACDRCRLKKSKCDGSSPCSRCQADNAICVFGERKKTQDKIYPKGYVEMLEQQQAQLVSGLRELYRRMQVGEGWPGQPLDVSHAGFPLTHDILERLDVLYLDGDSHSMRQEPFEDDLEALQRRCRGPHGLEFSRRRESSAESEPGLTSSESSYEMSSPTQSLIPSEHMPQCNDPLTPTMNFEAHTLLDQKAGGPAFPASRYPAHGVMTGTYWQQAWIEQQQPQSSPMVIDGYAYDAPACEGQSYMDPTTFQNPAMSIGWPDPFNQLINPNVLHTF